MFVNTATLLLAATSVVASSVQGDTAFLGIKGQAFNINGVTKDGQTFFQLKSVLVDDKLPSQGLSHDEVIAGPVNEMFYDVNGDPEFGVDAMESDDDKESETESSYHASDTAYGPDVTNAYALMCTPDMCLSGTIYVGEGHICDGYREDSLCANCCVNEELCMQESCTDPKDYIGTNSKGEPYHCTTTYDPIGLTSTVDCSNCCTKNDKECEVSMCTKPSDYIGDGYFCSHHDECDNCCGGDATTNPIFMCSSTMCKENEIFVGEGKECMSTIEYLTNTKQNCFNCCAHDFPNILPEPVASDLWNNAYIPHYLPDYEEINPPLQPNFIVHAIKLDKEQ